MLNLKNKTGYPDEFLRRLGTWIEKKSTNVSNYAHSFVFKEGRAPRATYDNGRVLCTVPTPDLMSNRQHMFNLISRIETAVTYRQKEDRAVGIDNHRSPVGASFLEQAEELLKDWSQNLPPFGPTVRYEKELKAIQRGVRKQQDKVAAYQNAYRKQERRLRDMARKASEAEAQIQARLKKAAFRSVGTKMSKEDAAKILEWAGSLTAAN